LLESANLDKYLIIGLGGFLGANLRYVVGGWAAEKWGASFPFGTLLINVTGSFVLGLFLAAVTGRLAIDPRWRLFFAIGFLGAYTTFSTYTYETMQLVLAGGWWPGLLNLVFSNLLGLGASLLGLAIGRGL
jgi:CrcB protein